jgi:cobalt-zinc-cadmium efflux system membrane fusion protein
VLQGDKGRYVLRRVGENSYVRTAVEVQSIDEHSLRVVKGLNSGDEIIMQGAFYLVDKR